MMTSSIKVPISCLGILHICNFCILNIVSMGYFEATRGYVSKHMSPGDNDKQVLLLY